MIKPFKHQEQALTFLDEHPRAGLFLEQGLGKTLTTLWSAQKHKAKRLFIAAPPIVCESVWVDNLLKHFPETWKVFIPYKYDGVNRAREVAKALAYTGPKVVITTYDSFLRYEKEFIQYAPDFAIFDEATALKNMSAKRTRIALKFTKNTARVIMATGTPITTSPMDLHGIGCFIAPDKIPPRMTWYRDRVMRRGFGEFEWIPRADWHKVECVRHILEHSFFMKLRDAVDMPPVTTTEIKVPLTDAQKAVLTELRTQAATLDGRITAVNVARLRNALIQISSGVVRDDDQSLYHIKSKRAEVIKELIDEADSQVIVFTWHTIITEWLGHELDAPIIHGATVANKRHIILNAFKAGEHKVIVANPQTVGHGVDLTNANRVIFAQLPDSLELYLQAISRVDRIGQAHPVLVYNLYSQTEATILKNLLTKREYIDTIEEYKSLMNDLYETTDIN